ncbi:hypothetical protein KY912_000214 [Vibrio vulnificus]|nr:hypothetical protein [Vibrio vulnificus]
MTRQQRLVEIRRLFKSIGSRLDNLEMSVEKEQLSNLENKFNARSNNDRRKGF